MKYDLTHVHVVGAAGTTFCAFLFSLDLSMWTELATIAAGFATAGYTLTHWFLLYKKHRRELLHPLSGPDGPN